MMRWIIDWSACALVKSLGWLLCHLPPSIALSLGECLGSLAFWFSSKRRRIGERNLRAAFDGRFSVGEIRQIIRRSFAQIGAGMIELLRLPVIDKAYRERYLHLEGIAHLEQAIASGRPVVLLTGHYGNWELLSIVAALIGHPIAALARFQPKLPRLYRLLVSYRESKGCVVVLKGSMRRLFSALKEGMPVGIVGDQASRRGVFVDFFGRQAGFASGPFSLAARSHAWIVPAFIHRLHGPHHRVVIEPAFSLSTDVEDSTAIREGIERFAQILARHITQDPHPWLWMHKRWKRTPSRKILLLSDGKAGHVKQSLAVVEVLRQQHPQLDCQRIEIRWRSRLCRALALLWSGWLPHWGGATCLRLMLTPQSAHALLSRYADLIISCGSGMIPANLLWASENGAKSVVIMNPSPVPLNRFSLVIAPQHDGLPRRSNVVQVPGALSALPDDELQKAAERLYNHPRFRREFALRVRSKNAISATSPLRHLATKGGISGRTLSRQDPAMALFIGGESPTHTIGVTFAQALVEQVSRACQSTGGWYLVTTSRRTAPAVEQALSERCGSDPQCGVLIVASRDPLEGTMEGLLALADVAVVTGESISMVSEACSAGRPVIVVEPPARPHPFRKAPTKQHRFITGLAQEGYVRLCSTSQVAETIGEVLQERHPGRRLDALTVVREALLRLFY